MDEYEKRMAEMARLMKKVRVQAECEPQWPGVCAGCCDADGTERFRIKADSLGRAILGMFAPVLAKRTSFEVPMCPYCVRHERRSLWRSEAMMWVSAVVLAVGIIAGMRYLGLGQHPLRLLIAGAIFIPLMGVWSFLVDRHIPVVSATTSDGVMEFDFFEPNYAELFRDANRDHLARP